MIEFVLPSCVTTPADEGVANGTISVLARDSDGLTMYYGLGPFPRGGRLRFKTINLFEDLLPGSYVVHAYVDADTFLEITMTVLLNQPYGVRHRLEFDKIGQSSYTANKTYRLDIEQLNYSGTITEEKAGGIPVMLSWRGEGAQDPFTPIIASQVEVTLSSPTDEYFKHLYALDDKQFRCRLYEYITSSYVLIWQGFLLPMFYSESYWTKINYEVTFTFTCGLGDIKKFKFSDDSGNTLNGKISVHNAVLACIRKTSNVLPIWESVNIVHKDFGDNPANNWNLFYINSKVYDGSNSYDALVSLLRNFKSRLYQSNGRWNIELCTDKSASIVLTRKFEWGGSYTGYSNLEPRIMLRKATAANPKLLLKERSGVLNVSETYGAYKVTHELDIEQENNVLPYGDFNPEQLVNGVPKGWTVTPTGSPASYGVAPSTNGGWAFLSRFWTSDLTIMPVNQIVTLASEKIFMALTANPYTIKFSFDIYCIPFYTKPYVFIDFFLTIGSFKLQSSEIRLSQGGKSYLAIDSADLLDGRYLRVFIDEPLKWKTITVEVLVNSPAISGDLQVGFRFSSCPIYDVSGITNLKTVSTYLKSTRTYNNRIRVLRSNAYGQDILYYQLERGNDAESSPEIIRPNDFNSLDPYVWKRKELYNIPTISVPEPILGAYNINQTLGHFLNAIYVDNVKCAYMPNNVDPVSSVVYTEVFNSKLVDVYEDTLKHCDTSIVNLFSSPLDSNYQYISDNLLTDGDYPVSDVIKSGWRRRIEDTSLELGFIKMLVRIVKAQFGVNRALLTGNFDTRSTNVSLWNTVYEVRTGRIYLPLAIGHNLRQATASMELVEILKGEPVEDVGVTPPDPIDPIEPSPIIREHTNEFSTEFS